MTLQLHSVHAIRETQEPDVFIVSCNLTDLYNETYDADYCSRPNDTFGLNPTIREWLIDNEGSYEVLPYVPPSIEQTRATMQPITPRQLRLALVRSGTSIATVETALDAIPDAQAKEEAKIEWEYANTFDRLAPALLAIASALSLTPEAVDTLWEAAVLI